MMSCGWTGKFAVELAARSVPRSITIGSAIPGRTIFTVWLAVAGRPPAINSTSLRLLSVETGTMEWTSPVTSTEPFTVSST